MSNEKFRLSYKHFNENKHGFKVVISKQKYEIAVFAIKVKCLCTSFCKE